MGWVAVRTDRQVLVGNSSPELIPFRREATVNAHGDMRLTKCTSGGC